MYLSLPYQKKKILKQNPPRLHISEKPVGNSTQGWCLTVHIPLVHNMIFDVTVEGALP